MTPIEHLPGYLADDRGIWSIKKGDPALLKVTGRKARRATVKTSAGLVNVWTAIATTCGVPAARLWQTEFEGPFEEAWE